MERTKIKLELDTKALAEELQRHGVLLEDVRNERDEIVTMLKETTGRYDKIQAELSDLRRRAQNETTDAMRVQSESDARQTELTTALRDARAEISRFKADLEAAQTSLAREQERLALLEEKLLEKTSEHSALRETSQLVMREHREATMRIQHLTSELDSIKRMRSVAEEEAAEVRSEKDALLKAIDAAKGSAHAEQAHLRTTFEARISELQSDLAKSQGVSQTLREEQSRMSMERDRLREKVAALETSCDNLRQSVRSVREQTLVDAQKEGHERVKSAQHQLKLARDEIASLQDELAERVGQSREAGEREQEAISKLNSQIDAQSSRIIRMDAILQAADREVRSLFSALRIEEGEIVNARASPGGSIPASVQSLAGRIATATSTIADKAARDGSSRAMLKLKEEELANLRHKRESENKALVGLEISRSRWDFFFEF